MKFKKSNIKKLPKGEFEYVLYSKEKHNVFFKSILRDEENKYIVSRLISSAIGYKQS